VPAQEPGATVLVAGATGGVGQLLTAKLLERGYTVRAMTRSKEKAAQLLGSAPGLEIVVGDLRDATTLGPAVQGVDAVCCTTGTTAFPSQRWAGDNGPERTDYEGVKKLIAAASPAGIKRFVLCTSAGVERTNSPPWSILNLFNVLKYKRMAELELISSGLPYTICRPGRLTDGPYTSYDLNTLLKGIAGSRQAVTLAARDELNGETSRIALAEAMLQSLVLEAGDRLIFSICSKEGEGPGQDAKQWRALFEMLG
jgi:uncharacterized protein YbjT (DUF2867 family)